tara:strand:+ start:661 stop:966 length:306 start_codon:yes stop_codon:yes gene_type:complete
MKKSELRKLVREEIQLLSESPKKSKGHIAFVNHAWDPYDFEYYIEVDHEVYRAPTSSALDIKGRRMGRWESSLPHALRYASVMGLNKNDIKKAMRKLGIKL